MTLGIVLLSILTIQESSWDVSRLVEIGGGGEKLPLKYVLFCILFLAIFSFESSRVKFLFRLSQRISSFRRKLLTALLLFLVSISTWIRDLFPDLTRGFYYIFGVNQLEPKYADLVYFAKTTSCPGIYRVGEFLNCQGESIPYLYPSSIIRFSVGLIDLRSYIDLLQVLQVSFFILIMVTLFYSGSQYPFWLVLTLIISPQMQLLFERGNLDLLVLSLSLTSCMIISRDKPHSYWISFMCLVLGSLLKFYLLPAVIVLSLIAFRRIQRLLAISITILLIVVLIPEIYFSSNISITELKGTFGLRSLISFVSGSTTVVSTYHTPIFALIVAICVFVFFTGYKVGTLFFTSNNDKRVDMVILTTIFLSLWFFTNSYHYKLVFLNVAFLFMARNFESPVRESHVITYLVVLNLLSILAYRETFFLISNVVITFSSGLLAYVLVQNLLRAFRAGKTSNFYP